MLEQQTVLLVGGTGRTGRRVLERLLSGGMKVRVIVRSARRLPAGAAEDPNLAVVEADMANPKAWDDWKGKLPVIVNATASRS